MRSHVFLFQGRFAPLVATGRKINTIRKPRKVLPHPGDIIDCRRWEGKPYRSKQLHLRKGAIVSVQEVVIVPGYVVFIRQGEMLSQPFELDTFARIDGFDSWDDMAEWLSSTHGWPFIGHLYTWSPMTP